jgi:sec-independent protein translocase protein TatB
MFDIGWTEMLVIAVVMIVVVGPKDLPRMLRTFGKTTAKLRTMAGDFQKQFNDALKEAELDDVKKSVDSLRNLDIKKQLNPFEKAAADVRAGLDSAMNPKPAATPDPASVVAKATDAAKPAEPLKNGAAGMPDVSGPESMPASAPVFPAAAEPATGVTPAAAAAKPKPKKPAAKVAASDGAKTTAAAKKTSAGASAKKTPATTKKSAGTAK